MKVVLFFLISVGKLMAKYNIKIPIHKNSWNLFNTIDMIVFFLVLINVNIEIKVHILLYCHAANCLYEMAMKQILAVCSEL